MKPNFKRFSSDYSTALQRHAQHGSPASLQTADALGKNGFSEGLRSPALARIHAANVETAITYGFSSTLYLGRMQRFLIETLESHEKSRRQRDKLKVASPQQLAVLTRQGELLAKTNLKLKSNLLNQAAVENKLRTALQTNKLRYQTLLAQAKVAQGQLRRLSHNVLSVQEEERKEISRELHDEIAQTLAGISVHLAALKQAASVNTMALKRKIERTQLFVERSVKIVHRFARELRPTLLDDLGLIPALQSYLKTYAERTGLQVNFKPIESVEKLSSAKRTVLYRVALEALTNVTRHAKASRVTLIFTQSPASLKMEVRDNGTAFNIEDVLLVKKNRRLGLIGMRERLEMIGGEFNIKSVIGRGTSILAVIPLGKEFSA